ncbi:hypothetical protein [Oleispirillum naphthae]|uniref:hypothetical protein n=1 Tax=Oleispirillum naphthae TaxID=2838853 RepID=UPI00308264CD
MSKENLTDIGIGGGALTVPLWVHQLEAWAQAFVLIGGAVLLALRLLLALKALRARRDEDEEGGPWTCI